MPCPYFEPHNIAAQQQNGNARLPLIDEYDGLCRAASEPIEAPVELRFRYCNHGYSKGSCERFPSSEVRSSLRYHVVGRTESALEFICIEEQNYAPLAWHRVQYFFAGERLQPELADACIQAQAIAFCQSYLKRFS
ncbi:MAG: hypothetical protein ACR2JB_18395 [Bryobacteraceae bacterium]